MKTQYRFSFLFLTIWTQNLLLSSVDGSAIIVNSSRNIPSMARKAGGTIRVKPSTEIQSENPTTEATAENSNSESKNESSLNSKSLSRPISFENDEYYEESSEEEDCPRGKFWHIRGLRCVPIKCPKGGSGRDKNTGECLSSLAAASKIGVCDYCIQNNIVPFGRCCTSLLRQPNMDTRKLRTQGGSTVYQGIRTKMENRKHRGRG